MRQVVLFFAIFLLASIVGCKTNNMNGIYVCDQAQKKADTTIKYGDNVERFMDLTCIIQELDFKGNSTVELKMNNGQLVTSYIVDKEYIRIKGSDGEILFKIQDNKTLRGENPFEGFYHKK